MDKLILNDFTEVDIQEGASLNDIKVIFPDYESFIMLAAKFTKQNLSHVIFQSNGAKSAEYYGMNLIIPNFMITKTDTGVEVSFGLCEITQEELQKEEIKMAVSYLSDSQTLTVKNLVPNWEDDPVGYEYSVDNPSDIRRNYNGDLWKLKKSHSKQVDWYPGADPTLWEQIVEGHEGTLEDPIPAVANMEYEYGKYYIENNVIYICKRGGVANPEEMYGQKITLQYLPSQLVGQYFEIVE